MIAAMDAAQPVSDPSMTILRGAGFPSSGMVLLTAAGFSIEGLDHGASVVLGGAMAIGALAVAPIVQRLTRRLDPAIVLGIAVIAYSFVMLIIGLTFSQVNDLPWVQSTPAGFGALVAIVGWTAGHMWTSQRLRQLLYDVN